MSNRISPRVLGAIIATGLLSFCGVVVETAMNITFPTLMREFHVPTDSVQWMTTLYLLVVAAMVPLSAILKRRFRLRPLFLVAVTLFIIGVALDGVAMTFAQLLLGRAIQGLGTGIALPLMFNIILEQVPLARRGTMMGVGTMITGVAPAVGPTFGGVVVATLNWRWIFALLLPVLVVALVLGLICIRQTSPTEPVHFDWGSIGMIALAFSGLIFGLSNMGKVAFLSWPVGGALLIGALSLAAFTWRSLHLKTPIIKLRLFANAGFTQVIVAFVGVQVSALGMSFLLPNYIQLVNGRSALVAGLVVLPGAALGAVAGPLSGRLLDAVGAKLPLRLGTTLMAVATLGFWLMGTGLSDGAITGWYILFMLGMGISYGNLMTFGLRHLPEQTSADGNAVFNTLQQFAAAVGTSVCAAIVATAQATAGQHAGTIAGSTTSFLVLLVLLVVAWVVLWRQTGQEKG